MWDLSTAECFAMAEANADAEPKVFDWITAAKLIALRKPKIAQAGLAQDWSNTAGIIYTADGIPRQDESYTFLSSVWATPQLNLDGERITCWLYKADSPGGAWDSETYWPDEAKTILMEVAAR
jgi:hypothetical protein